EVDHVPPKVFGYSTCSHSVAHPPLEWPLSKRPLGLASMRYLCSNMGINSLVSARPQGPLLTESANSTQLVGNDSSSMTKIIGGIECSSIISRIAAARDAMFPALPPNPCVQYTVG